MSQTLVQREGSIDEASSLGDTETSSVDPSSEPSFEEPPLPPGLQRLRAYADHASHLLHESLGVGPRVPFPSHIPISIQAELEKMVDKIVQAWSNQVTLPFAIDDMLDVVNASRIKNKDEVLRSRFSGAFPRKPDGSLRLLNKPTVFVDQKRVVVAWYLPHIFTQARNAHVYESVRQLSEGGGSILRFRGTGSNWRSDQAIYYDPRHCVLNPGHVNISLCWYQQGFGPNNAGTDRLPAPSRSLTDPSEGGRSFVERETDTSALMGAILSLVHPELFEMQFCVLKRLHSGDVPVGKRPLLTKLMDWWSNPFTGFALISNRETPYHRDTKGGKQLLDLLAAFGNYTGGRLEVPCLGARFAYEPCTAFIMPGYLFEHGASKTNGERICYANFIKPNVGRAALGEEYSEVPPPTVEGLGSQHGFGYEEM